MSKKEMIVFSIIIATFAGVLANRYLANVLDIPQSIELTILFALVLVTTIYAKRTAQMAKEMKEQTETLKKTISLSVRPSISLIVFNIAGEHNYLFEPPNLLEFEARNTGKGSAMNVAIICEGKTPEVEYTKIELPYLNVGDKSRHSIQRIREDSDDKLKTPYLLLAAIYNDQLGESWRTTLQIDLDGEWKSGETITEELGKH